MVSNNSCILKLDQEKSKGNVTSVKLNHVGQVYAAF